MQDARTKPISHLWPLHTGYLGNPLALWGVRDSICWLFKIVDKNEKPNYIPIFDMLFL
jgi:hypothetical protein